MSTTPDNESEHSWPDTPYIDKNEFIELIHAVKPNLTKKKIRAEIRHCQTYTHAKHDLPRGDSFPNKKAADWIREKHPELVCLSGFPKQPKTDYYEFSWLNIDVPPLDELPLAYMQCFSENYHLKERNLALEKENRYLNQRQSKWGGSKLNG